MLYLKKKIMKYFSHFLKKKKDCLQFIWKKRIGYNFLKKNFKKNNSFSSK